MPNRLIAIAFFGLTTAASTSTPSNASDDLLRHVGFGGVCADCDLSGKDLSGVAMRGASFPRANFTGAKLIGAKISGSNFGRAIFRRADFSDAMLSGSNFARCDLTGAKLVDIEAKGINLAYATLNGVQGEGAELVSSNLSHSNLVGAKFPNATFDRSNLSYADLGGAEMQDASLNRVNLIKARLDDAKLMGASFERANLSRAEFGRANVRDANFEYAILSGANLYKVKGLKQEQLNGACGSEKTILPKGIKLQACEESREAKVNNHRMGTGFSHSFSFNLDDRDRRAIAEATDQAMRESRYALQKARIALANALNDPNMPEIIIQRNGTTFSWPHLDDEPGSEEQRALERAQRTLDGLKLDNRRAQRSVAAAIRSLERALEILRSSTSEKELAGK